MRGLSTPHPQELCEAIVSFPVYARVERCPTVHAMLVLSQDLIRLQNEFGFPLPQNKSIQHVLVLRSRLLLGALGRAGALFPLSDGFFLAGDAFSFFGFHAVSFEN